VPDVLVDAGALIALLDRDDRHHDQCVATLKRLHDPLATVWPALTEAMHLLGDVPAGRDALCDMVFDGALELVDIEPAALVRLKELMRKYRDLPMDFADAALVYAAERERLTHILTFDRHFTIYRLPRRGRFTVLPTR
jgi:hypothetical protein